MFENCKDILNVGDICSALHVSRNSVYNLINNGTLKSIKVGRIHKIAKVWLMEFINKAGFNQDTIETLEPKNSLQ